MRNWGEKPAGSINKKPLNPVGDWKNKLIIIESGFKNEAESW